VFLKQTWDKINKPQCFVWSPDLRGETDKARSKVLENFDSCNRQLGEELRLDASAQVMFPLACFFFVGKADQFVENNVDQRQKIFGRERQETRPCVPSPGDATIQVNGHGHGEPEREVQR